MSYHGTVTCSHCYQRGHNKRKCPDLTKQILRRYRSAQYDVSKDPEDSYAKHWADQYRRQYIKRTGLDPDTGKKFKKAAAKAERMKSVQCTYCGEMGHTRRICKPLKQDRLVFIEATKEARAAVLAQMGKVGFNVGSMIARETWCPERATHVKRAFLLRAIDWVDCTAEYPTVRGRFWIPGGTDPYFAGKTYSFQDISSRPESFSYSGAGGAATPPKGWLEAEDVAAIKIGKLLPTGQSRRYIYRCPVENLTGGNIWYAKARQSLAEKKF